MSARFRACLLAPLTAAAFAASPVCAQSVLAGIQAWHTADYAEAVRQWSPLAEAGDADAQFNLGHAYRLGRGIAQDPAMAERYYGSAARQGHKEAQALYGLLLFQNGRRREAMPWIERAAEQGDAVARYVLGTALFNGDIVEPDLPRAYALMRSAAAAGLPQAEQQLRLMEPHLTPEQRARGTELALNVAGEAPAASAPPEAAPAPPRTAPAPAAAPAPPAGRWRVQLGAFSSEANAAKHWQDVSRAVAVLAGLQPKFESAGALTRLQAGGLPDRAAAERLCAALRRAGKGCFPVAP